MTFAELLAAALEIKNELIKSANTAMRVGSLFEKILRFFIGPWNNGSEYKVGQYVVFSGQIWRCVVATQVGESPTSAPDKWEIKTPSLQLITQYGGNKTNRGIQTAYYDTPSYDIVTETGYVIVPKVVTVDNTAVERLVKISVANLGVGSVEDEFTYEADSIYKKVAVVTMKSQKILAVTAQNEGTETSIAVEITYSDNSKGIFTGTGIKSSSDPTVQWDGNILRVLANTTTGDTRQATLIHKIDGLEDAMHVLTAYDTTAVEPNNKYRIVKVTEGTPTEGDAGTQYKFQFQATNLQWYDFTGPHSFRAVGAPFGVNISTGGLLITVLGSISSNITIPIQVVSEVSGDLDITIEAESCSGPGSIYDKQGASGGKIKDGKLIMTVNNTAGAGNFPFKAWYQTNVASPQTGPVDYITVNGTLPKIPMQLAATGGVLRTDPTQTTIPLQAGNNTIEVDPSFYTAHDRFQIVGSGASQQVLAALDVTIINVDPQANRQPVIVNAMNDQTVPQGETTVIDLSFTGDFSDPDDDDLTYNLRFHNGSIFTYELPSWAVLDLVAETLAVTPPITGPNVSYLFQRIASDGTLSTLDDFLVIAQAIPEVVVGDWTNRYLFPNNRTQAELAADGFDLANGVFAANGGLLKQTSNVANSATATATLVHVSGIDDPMDSDAILVRFRVNQLSGHFTGFTLRAPDIAHGFALTLSGLSGIALQNVNVGILDSDSYNWELGKWYYARINYTETGTSTATISAKLWRESQVEPGWQLVAENAPRLNGKPMLFMGGNNGSGSSNVDVSVIYTHKPA